MREIKFRGIPLFEDGRRSDHFVYGHFFKLSQNGVIRHVIQDHSWSGTYIDPETLGQFTGMYDKNHQEIYEGDILQDKQGRNFEVFFEDGEFQRYNEDIGNMSLFGSKLFFEVVGNIHDNPELMEGGVDQ